MNKILVKDKHTRNHHITERRSKTKTKNLPHFIQSATAGTHEKVPARRRPADDLRGDRGPSTRPRVGGAPARAARPRRRAALRQPRAPRRADQPATRRPRGQSWQSGASGAQGLARRSQNLSTAHFEAR